MEFYKKTYFIILALLIFAPLGIFLLWKYKKEWITSMKIICTVLSFSLLGCVLYSNNTNATAKQEQKPVEQTITQPQEQKPVEQAPTQPQEQKPVEQAPTQPQAQKPTEQKEKEHYTSCKEMRKVHPNGAVKGDPWYNPALDRDKDGKACETSA